MTKNEINSEIARLEAIINSSAGRTQRDRAQEALATLYYQRDRAA